MQKKLFILFLFLTSILGFSQSEKTSQTDQKTKIKGRVVDVTTKFPLKSAHILNLNTVRGTVTNKYGEFEIKAKKNDTLFISYIGYESVKLKVTNDFLKNDNLVIAIHEKTFSMKEVKVKSHKLIGVLAVDAKNVPEGTPTRVHINGLAQAYEIGKPKSRNYESPLAAVFNPIDFWYNKLGKKSKELKKLKKIRSDDNLRDMMEQNFNREIMLEYLDLDRKELNDLLKDCNYSKRFIKKASDLQIVEAVLNCYESHKTNKKGKVKKEIIHLSEE
jgi:hypothetical protein